MTGKGERPSAHWKRVRRAVRNGELARRGARTRLAEELGISRQRVSEMIAEIVAAAAKADAIKSERR